MNITSSVTYEILFYMNYVYLSLFILVEVMMGILKAWNTNYPIDALLSESCLFIIMCLNEVLRIYLGRRGNLLNKKPPVFCSVLLTIPSVTGICYFLSYQTYILKLDCILGVVLLIFQVIELVYGIKFLVTFCKKPSVIR